MKLNLWKNKKASSSVQKANTNILRLIYVIVFLFLCMIAYVVYFLAAEREDVINNTYNARLDSFSERVLRGKILSSDGAVLARTETGEDGSETRVYPYGELFAHVVGYSTKGKTGLESLGNFYMLTSHVNLIDQVVAELSGMKRPGDHVVTTLDLELQQTASDALGDRRGAVVVMEPDTGKILAMVSKPAYDPNTLEQDWEQLISADNDQAQLLNRASQGLYPPGSTFKIVTLLEYIREHPQDYDQYHFDCDGYYEHGDYTIQCYHGTAHGSETLASAFANSCNGAFAGLGLELNLKRLEETAEMALFNRDLPFSMAYSKSRFSMTEGANDWEILQTSIGQGATQITPLHSCLITAAIANGGTLMKPYLIDRVDNDAGETVKKFMPKAYGDLMTANEANILTELMEKVVTEGTGSAVRTDAYSAAGKTGSAEFETGKETHGWFTGFAPVDDPAIAVTVLVEEGGSGGTAAAPVARQIFDAYFSR